MMLNKTKPHLYQALQLNSKRQIRHNTYLAITYLNTMRTAKYKKK